MISISIDEIRDIHERQENADNGFMRGGTHQHRGVLLEEVDNLRRDLAEARKDAQEWEELQKENSECMDSSLHHWLDYIGVPKNRNFPGQDIRDGSLSRVQHAVEQRNETMAELAEAEAYARDCERDAETLRAALEHERFCATCAGSGCPHCATCTAMAALEVNEADPT